MVPTRALGHRLRRRVHPTDLCRRRREESLIVLLEQRLIGRVRPWALVADVGVCGASASDLREPIAQKRSETPYVVSYKKTTSNALPGNACPAHRPQSHSA